MGTKIENTPKRQFDAERKRFLKKQKPKKVLADKLKNKKR